VDDHERIVHAALEEERLHNARRINAFRLLGLLVGLASARAPEAGAGA